MKRALLAALALLLIGAAGLALVFSRNNEPMPPGFVSIRTAPAFQDAALLERAWALPVAATFPHPVVSQTNPSACGPTSGANVFRSEGKALSSDDVAAHGKGCVGGICFGGLTLAQLGDALRETSPEFKVTELHPATPEEFREELRHANDPDRRLIINFTRRPLFGTGGGHHSPIGGYLEAEDLVFVLDVNEHYGPWLVSSARLFEAMDTVDPSSGQKRGLLRLIE